MIIMVEEVDVTKILDFDLINLSLKATSKDEVIHELSELLLKKKCISDLKGFISDVYLREQEGITGMGNNVAIPHGKSKDVVHPSIAIGRTNHMIEWESYDNQPVQLFFLFAVPDDTAGAKLHLKLLSQIASKLANEAILEKLKKVSSKSEFINILSNENE